MTITARDDETDGNDVYFRTTSQSIAASWTCTGWVTGLIRPSSDRLNNIAPRALQPSGKLDTDQGYRLGVFVVVVWRNWWHSKICNTQFVAQRTIRESLHIR
jgi:hypothetical protein